MFRVSLLPAAYRKRLEEKKKKDLLARIALIVLLCLAIVYAGIFVQGQVLNSKLKKLERENAELQQQFPALQQYQTIFNDLQSAKQMVESVSPQDPEAVEFLTLIANNTPDYIQVQEINLENWFTAGVCTLTCTCLDYSDVNDFKASFETEEMQETVKLVQLTSITRQVTEDGKKAINFTLALSMSNAVQVPTEAPKYEVVTDKKGEAVTNNEGETETTMVTQAAATAGNDSNADGTTAKN
ncbi:MAG: PilN domain-containing protein [Candidatus Fimenecus sp.]